jgi:hypothetical protein
MEAGKNAASCGMQSTSATGCTRAKAVFDQPVQTAYDSYFAAQTLLAGDSLEGLSKLGKAIATSVRTDSAKTLPAAVADQAEALAKAKDLKAAREAFKPLSTSLIQFAKSSKVTEYHEAYCPMAKASWLQSGKVIVNPYMGKSMLHCGEIKG